MPPYYKKNKRNYSICYTHTNMYTIYRYFNNIGKRERKPAKLIKKVRTLIEARQWCNDPSTIRSTYWFDGYKKV